jgi:hypothetical protein
LNELVVAASGVEMLLIMILLLWMKLLSFKLMLAATTNL